MFRQWGQGRVVRAFTRGARLNRRDRQGGWGWLWRRAEGLVSATDFPTLLEEKVDEESVLSKLAEGSETLVGSVAQLNDVNDGKLLAK